MKNLINRIACALQVLTRANVMVLFTKPGEEKNKGKDALVLFGTIEDKQRQVYLLETLAASIKQDIEDHTWKVRGTEPGDRKLSREQIREKRNCGND